MSATASFDLGLGLEGTHVLVTGGAGLIGSAVVEAFLAAGARVSSLDFSYEASAESSAESGNGGGGGNGSLLKVHTDISSASSLTTAWTTATRHFGTVEVCIALAALDLSVLPQTDSIINADPETWSRVLDVNVKGTMLTAQAWLRGLQEAAAACETGSSSSKEEQPPPPPPPLQNPSLILMGSEAGHFGVRTCAAYAAAKAAVQYGLLQSLRADAPRIHPEARVNAVAPGPVDTVRFREETMTGGGHDDDDDDVAAGAGATTTTTTTSDAWWAECQATTALAQPVPVEAVARAMLFLASKRWSGNIHGKCVDVDSGKMGALMWRPQEFARRAPGAPNCSTPG